MNKTKAELTTDLKNMTTEKDILFDELESTKVALEKLEDDLVELDRKSETLDILIDYIDRYQTANQRYSMGILSEIETMENLITEILTTKRNYIHESKNF